MEATPETLALVELVEKEWGQLKMQRGPEDFKIKEIRAQRELVADPNYQPEYFPMPKKGSLSVEVSPAEEAILAGLVEEGHYGPTREQALVVAFVRWYDQNRMQRRFMRLEFEG